jgi:hypothetical protein
METAIKQLLVAATQSLDMFESKKPVEPSQGVQGSDNSTIQGSGNTIDNSTKNFFGDAVLLPSTLASVVNILGKRLSSGDTFVYIDDFSIEHKKDFNNVRAYRDIMDEYGLLVGKLTAVYNECDEAGTNITFNTLSNIRLHYLKVKKELTTLHPKLPAIEVVRMFSDEIFERVEQRLLEDLKRSSNIAETIESVHLSIQVIMIDAFIKCKILENPIENAAA